jgi:hypothetical protein
MSQDLHELDDLFRSGLEGKAEAPPRAVWDAIEKRLDASIPAPGSPGSTTPPKPGPGWIKGLGGIALVGIVAATFLVTRKDTPIREARNSAMVKSVKSEAPAAIPDIPMSATAGEEIHRTTGREETKQDAKAEPDEESAVKEGRKTESNSWLQVIKTIPNPIEIGKTGILGNKSDRPGIPSNVTQTAVHEPMKPTGKALLSEEKAKDSQIIAAPLKTTVSPEQQTHSQVPRTVAETQARSTPAKRAAEAKGFEDDMMGNVMAKIQCAPHAGAEVSAEKEKTMEAMAVGKQGAWQGSDQKADSRMASEVVGLNGNKPVDGAGPSSPKSLKSSPFLSRFSVTPVIAYNHTSIEVRENRSHQGRPGDEHRSFSETEKSSATLSPGMLAEFRLTPSLSVQSGVVGLTNRLRIDEKDIKAVRDRDGSIRYRLDCSAGSYFIDPKTGAVPNTGDSIRIGSSEVSTRYVGIPLTLQLRVGKGRVRYFGTAGLNVNLLTGKQASAVINGATNQPVSPVRSEGLKTAFTSGVVGGGVDIRLNKRVSVTVQPQYRFSLGKANEGFRENAFPKTFSVMSGLKFDF